MTGQEIKQFAEALAVRYKQTDHECEKARSEYQAKLDSGDILGTGFQVAYLNKEKACAKRSLFVEVIHILPHEIAIKFYESKDCLESDS